jgi:hypothetical protein
MKGVSPGVVAPLSYNEFGVGSRLWSDNHGSMFRGIAYHMYSMPFFIHEDQYVRTYVRTSRLSTQSIE